MMEKGRKEYDALNTFLAALYLRGAPRAYDPPKRRWPQVASHLCQHTLESASSVIQSLFEFGFTVEALCLEDQKLLKWAKHQVRSGRVIGFLDTGYPTRWQKVLGHNAPPVLWSYFDFSLIQPSRFITVVGSRSVEPATEHFAMDVGQEVSQLGFKVMSGGARGCDHAAAVGAGEATEVLPFGLDTPMALRRRREGAVLLSVCAPYQDFTAASAMERNSLLYAASEFSVIVHARFKQGGTWTGAVQAMRAKATSMIVRQDPNDLASKSLIALGGTPLEAPCDLRAAMEAPPLQACLYAS